MINTNASEPQACKEGDQVEPIAAFVGIEWGDKEHCFCIQSQEGRESGRLTHSSENLHQWMEKIQLRFGAKTVAFALEATSGGLLAGLMEYAWARIYPIHPITSRRFRTAFSPSGAKDDMPDAQVMLEILLGHREKIRVLEAKNPRLMPLERLSRIRRGAVDRRTELTNKTRNLLKTYYPQALQVLGENLASPLAMDFLQKWPDLTSLKSARPSSLTKFFYARNSRSEKKIQRALSLVAKAKAISTDESAIEIHRLELELLIQELRVLHKNIKLWESKIKELFKDQDNASFYANLPGAGPQMAPRLMVAFEGRLEPATDAQALQKYSGVAPVRESSGAQSWTHRRFNPPSFLHQTFVEWAGLSVMYSAWAKAYYQLAKKRGKGHYAILRALAFKWIRILCRCLAPKTDCDENRYIQCLIRRNSPVAKVLAA